MARITWTPAKKLEIAQRSFEIRQQHSEYSDIECVRQAMHEVVSPEKYRDLRQMAEVDFIMPVWTNLTKAQKEKEALMEPKPTNVKQFPAAIRPIVNPAVEHASVFDAVSIEDMATEVIAQELVKRLLHAVNPTMIRSLIRDEVESVLEARIPQFLLPRQEPEVEEVPAERVQLKHVCVIGLLPKQKEVLETEFRDRINFFFLEGNEGKKVKRTAETMDLTVKTKWVKGHLPDMHGVPNFVFANGLDSVRLHINQLLRNTAAKTA